MTPSAKLTLKRLFFWLTVLGIVCAWISTWYSEQLLTTALLTSAFVAGYVGWRLQASILKKVSAVLAVFFLTTFIEFVLLVVVSFSHGFGMTREYIGMTYPGFRWRLGNLDFDPKGASNISYRYSSSIDSYDIWCQMSIGREDYTKLLHELATNLQDPMFASYKGERVAPVKHIASSATIPVHWPEPRDQQPTWWNVPVSSPTLESNLWELQVRKSDLRAKGWCWVYDDHTQQLWIWEWNYQWHNLGW